MGTWAVIAVMLVLFYYMIIRPRKIRNENQPSPVNSVPSDEEPILYFRRI